jgi:hypothetical protein
MPYSRAPLLVAILPVHHLQVVKQAAGIRLDQDIVYLNLDNYYERAQVNISQSFTSNEGYLLLVLEAFRSLLLS